MFRGNFDKYEHTRSDVMIIQSHVLALSFLSFLYRHQRADLFRGDRDGTSWTSQITS